MIAATAAREILRRLHDVMASKANAQAKLNQVVGIIAEALSSEVCSIYLLRDGVLELLCNARSGAGGRACHQAGDGRRVWSAPLPKMSRRSTSPKRAEHPDFAYRPETGEELFHSFAGVPIVRREDAVGVLCVQHVEPRDYDDVEIEALQTVAMVLSELIANAG
jgi:phosphotransferase system enzyme I (PtsP)